MRSSGAEQRSGRQPSASLPGVLSSYALGRSDTDTFVGGGFSAEAKLQLARVPPLPRTCHRPVWGAAPGSAQLFGS